MQFLIFTIIFSSIIYVIFKFFDRFHLKTFQAIVANYFTCSVIGFCLTGVDQFSENLIEIRPALPYAIILGCCFIFVFNCIATTSQKFGIGIASIADKLSLVMPVVFAFLAYQDSITVFKILGILLSIAAVYLSVKKNHSNSGSAFRNEWYYPVLVFAGAGLISILLKEVQFRFPEINFNQFLIFLFGIAYLAGMFFLLFQIFRNKTKFHVKSIISGVLLGFPNYASMYFLLKTLDFRGWESSVVYPLVNVGVVLFTVILGIIIFREQFKRNHQIGFILSIIAITLLLIESLNA